MLKSPSFARGRSTITGFALLAGAVIPSCTSSNFSSSSGKAGGSSSPSAADVDGAPAPVAATAVDPGNSDASANGTGSANAAVSSCSSGCCPSQKVAFVDCSGAATPAALKKGDFNITTVACDASVAGYDTIVYYGPIDQQTTALPMAIDAALQGGAKVIALPTGATGLIDHAFYGLTLENNLEFLSTIGTATVSVVNTNPMSSAFSKSTYSAATLNYLQFLGPFLLVDPTSFTTELEADWCSDLTARSVLEVQLTTFHGFLMDHAPRKGTLILSTMSLPNDGSGFDFSEPFMAAHLSQKWNAKGGSAQCGLSCNNANGGSSGFTRPTGVGKPVLYLYPTNEEEVSVKLVFDGKLVTTYPKYNAETQGWKVRARPDGHLVDLQDEQEYSYIYWNGTTQAFIPDLSEGFVVKGEDSRRFLQKTLSRMGMTPHEYNDMIVYWLPYLERHPYNLISFAQDSYTKIAPMTIEPKPDALLRVFMVFKGLEQPVSVKPQKLQTFKRHGFTAVEWGGTELDGEWHVIQ